MNEATDAKITAQPLDPTACEDLGTDPEILSETDGDAGRTEEAPAPAPAGSDPSCEAPVPDLPEADTDSDPAPGAAAGGDGDDLTALREEVARLRAELDERTREMERMGADCEEFRTLYPDVSLSALPDKVWEDVRNGVPLSAAFALSERRRAVAEARAERANAENRLRSSGRISGSANEYFTPAEVRAMSREEVRANFQKIMRSMPKWQ